ncbi:MAG: DUF4419 domain-containing protein [Bacteroidales bacterium]|nr:DUF4419 domain-containing protein [Bacteroidales bacterium]
MKRLVILFVAMLTGFGVYAQTPGFTFALDEVEKPEKGLYGLRSGEDIAKTLHTPNEFDAHIPEILANSFKDEPDLHVIGEDVLFQMLVKAWCQHRPVVLTPDAIWMVISQGFSHYVNKNPEKVRNKLVSHEGQMVLRVRTNDLLSSQADWEGTIGKFVSEIGKYTNEKVAETLVADFSTTGVNERIASEITLMDVVKPYFKYEAFYIVCGIPSITLTGTPMDWEKVLAKTKALRRFGLDWWVNDLEPILEEFINASKGRPDYWFWKDIVCKTRPRTVQGPTCARHSPPVTKVDGWFLKFFPFDSNGRTPEEVPITKTMLSETVCVPFTFIRVDERMEPIDSTKMELVAGIVAVKEDPATFALTPHIGWLVRTPESEESIAKRKHEQDSISRAYRELAFAKNNNPRKYWDEGHLRYGDFASSFYSETQQFHLEYGIEWSETRTRAGNTTIISPTSRAFMVPSGSWIDPKHKTGATLTLAQNAFNYVELARRKAQQELVSGTRASRSALVATHLDLAKENMAKMIDSTQNGNNLFRTVNFLNSTKEELEKTPEAKFEDLHLIPTGFGFALHCNAGYELFFGDITDYVTPLAGVGFGFDVTYNKFALMLDGLLGWGGRYKKTVTLDGYSWNAGEKITGGNLSASLGYALYNTQWWKITPFAGIGVGFLDYPHSPANPAKKSDEIAGFRFQGGLAAEYKLNRIVHIGGAAEQTVRARMYVARTSLRYLPQPWSLNLGLGINLIEW